MFWLGWSADYPDGENFLSLLYVPSGKTQHDGENIPNYDNPAYDRLFQQMKSMPDGAAKQALVDRMVRLVQEDAPWTMGFFSYTSAAAQRWVHNYKLAILVRDHGRYLRLDVQDRVASLRAWNRPVWWPVALLGAVWALRRRLHRQRLRVAPAVASAVEQGGS